MSLLAAHPRDRSRGLERCRGGSGMPHPWEEAVGSGLACMSKKWGDPAAGETLEPLA